MDWKRDAVLGVEAKTAMWIGLAAIVPESVLGLRAGE